MTQNIETEIHQFIYSIRDLWKDEPLDGDETESIAQQVLQALDIENGNR